MIPAGIVAATAGSYVLGWAIDRPVLLVHGDDDRFVPVSHGRWLAERIPTVEARIDSGDGHLTLVERRMREVNEWLLSHS